MASVLVNKRIHCEARILLDRWQILCLDSTLPGGAGWTAGTLPSWI